ncbi:transposase [bacterium]|nr:transposase [bacterium]
MNLVRAVCLRQFNSLSKDIVESASSCQPIRINHILIGMKPNIDLSSLIRDIKANSTKFINEKNWVRGRFIWQEGFGAFSYSHSQLNGIVNYIQNQEKHHSRKSFKEEYLEILKKFNVEYDMKYVFDWIGNE